MTKENKYPVKYAVLELTVPGGWLVNYEPITCGYVASKCYVIESNIKYEQNTATHTVFFPLLNIEDFIKAMKYKLIFNEEPKFPESNCQQNIQIVDNLYDSYDEAREAAILKNEFLDDKFYLAYCNEFEGYIQENTAEIKETKSNDSLSLILKL